MTLAELRAKAAELAKQIRQQADAYNERKKANTEHWPDATLTAWDAVNKDYDDTRAAIKALEDDAAMTARMNQITEDENRSTRHGRQMPGLDDNLPGQQRTYGEAGFDRDAAANFAQREVDRRNALRAFVAAASPGAHSLITEEMRASCQRLGCDPNQQAVRLGLLDTENFSRLQRLQRNNPHGDHEAEVRAMAKGTSGAGAELVPTTFLTTLELAMLATSPFLAYCDVITTETGEPMQWPIADDTGESATIIAEAGSQDTDPTDATLSTFTLSSYNYSSAFIKVSMQLSRDSLVNIDQLLAQLIGERIARKVNTDITTGDGSSKPYGIVTQTSNGKTAASATAITAGELIDLQHSVDPAYRTRGTFMSHDSVIAALRKLADSNGRYLWASGLADARPDTLLGQGIIYNQAMASSIAASAKTVVYGDLKYYKWRRVGNVQIFKANERFIDKLQYGFMGYLAADGNLLKWSGSVPVKRLTQAAS